MAVIHFVGANGFPAKTYQHIFEALHEHRLYYINVVAQQLSGKKLSWDLIADEIIANIEKNNCAPVIGIGHSMGASTTLLAAQKRPDLFSKLILIEPALFKPIIRMLICIRGISDKQNGGNPLAKQARERRHEFTSKQEAQNYFSAKPLFKNFSDISIKNYVEYGIEKKSSTNTSDKPFHLSFSKETEADIFANSPLIVKKPVLDIPIKVLFGISSDISSYMHIGLWKKYINRENIFYRPGGHLFPFEEPEIFCELLDSLIKNDGSVLKKYMQASKQLTQASSSIDNTSNNKFSISKRINAPASKIFPYLIDEDKRPLWINGLRNFNYIHKTSHIKDSIFKQRIATPGQNRSSIGIISEYHCNNSITFKIKNSVLATKQIITLEEIGDTTLIKQDITFKLLGFAKLLAPLIQKTVNLTLRRQISENVMNLKKIMES